MDSPKPPKWDPIHVDRPRVAPGVQDLSVKEGDPFRTVRTPAMSPRAKPPAGRRRRPAASSSVPGASTCARGKTGPGMKPKPFRAWRGNSASAQQTCAKLGKPQFLKSLDRNMGTGSFWQFCWGDLDREAAVFGSFWDEAQLWGGPGRVGTVPQPKQARNKAIGFLSVCISI